MHPGLRTKHPTDETGLGSSSSCARHQRLRNACVAGGLRIDALVDVVAHMRSAKVGLVTRDCCCRTSYRASRT